MTGALEIGGAFLFMATLLIAVMFLAAFQLGRLVTRDDEQREVEVVRAPKMAVHDLAMATAYSRGAGSGTSTRPTRGRRASYPYGAAVTAVGSERALSSLPFDLGQAAIDSRDSILASS